MADDFYQNSPVEQQKIRARIIDYLGASVDLQGGGSFGRERDVPIPLGGGEVGNLNQTGFGVGGRARLNLNTSTPLDATVGGFFGQGTNRFSENVRRLGAPAEKIFTSKGVNELGLGIGDPETGRFGVSVQNPFDPRRRGFRLGFQRRF